MRPSRGFGQIVGWLFFSGKFFGPSLSRIPSPNRPLQLDNSTGIITGVYMCVCSSYAELEPGGHSGNYLFRDQIWD